MNDRDLPSPVGVAALGAGHVSLNDRDLLSFAEAGAWSRAWRLMQRIALIEAARWNRVRERCRMARGGRAWRLMQRIALIDRRDGAACNDAAHAIHHSTLSPPCALATNSLNTFSEHD